MRWKAIVVLSSIMIFASCDDDKDPGKPLIAYNVAMNAEQTDYDIWVVDPVSLEQKNITNNPDVAWVYHSHKDRMFFLSDRDTCSRCFFLYEMDANGGNLKRITDFRMKDSWLGTRKNGTELVVTPHSSVDSVFYIIDRQGNILSKIFPELPSFGDPVFSPEENEIAFRGGTKSSKRLEGYEEEIYKIGVEGGDLEKITTYPTSDTTAPWYAYKAGPPRWHPTENFISYQSLQNGKYSLYGVSEDGTRHWKLTENTMEEGWHNWNEKGTLLAIEVFDSLQTQFHIALMDWKSKTQKILTDTTFAYQQAPVFIDRKK